MKKRYWLGLLCLVVIGVAFAFWTKGIFLTILILLSPLGFGIITAPHVLFMSSERGKRLEGLLKAIFLSVSVIGGFSGLAAIGILAKGCADSVNDRPAAVVLQIGFFFLSVFLASIFICGYVLKDYEP